MPRNRNKTSPVTIASKIKAVKALELRAEGMTFPDIAKKLGYNRRQSAHAAVTNALKEILREPVEHLIKMDLERLDRLWTVHYLNAQAGDVQALAGCLKIMERRAKLLGLDKPTKVDADVKVEVEEVDHVVIYLPDNGRK